MICMRFALCYELLIFIRYRLLMISIIFELLTLSEGMHGLFIIIEKEMQSLYLQNGT